MVLTRPRRRVHRRCVSGCRPGASIDVAVATFLSPPPPLWIESFEPRLLLAAGTFTAAYFNNADLTAPVLTRADSTINFDWGSASPAPGIDPNTFSVRWNGRIQPQYSQTYTFFSTADDGVRLWVNGQPVIDQWNNRPRLLGDANGDGVVNFTDFQLVELQSGSSNPQSDFNNDGTVDSADFKIFYDNYGKTASATSPTASGTITLIGGQVYDLKMEYFQDAGQANAKLEWQSDGQTRQVVPAVAPDPGGGGTGAPIIGNGNGLLATYFDNMVLTGTQVSRIDPQVDFDWNGQRPDPRIESDTFSVRWEGQVEAPVTGTYIIDSNTDDGTRVWLNGNLIIDQWGPTGLGQFQSSAIQLVAGQRYDLRMEYQQNYGSAVAQLAWEGPIPYQIIPTSQLYAADSPSDPMPPAQSVPSLQVSGDGHFIVKSDGSPFFWLADTAWALFNATSRADVDYYLNDRADKQFTVTQAVLYNPDAFTKNYYDQPVFLNNDPTTPNPSDFQHVDYVLKKAQSLGMYVAMLPTWGDAVAATDNRRLFNTANAFTYGQWLGKRYANQSNIVWVLGGDWAADTSAIKDVWRAMAAGLAAGDGGTHLITYHPRGGDSSTSYFGQGESWLAFNEIQSGHSRDSANYDLVAADYSQSPAKPTIDAEPNYENIPNNLDPTQPRLNDYDVRKKTYWSLFAGAFGAAYGNYEVYQFADGSEPGTFPWKQALDYPGATQMQYARRLMQSRPYLGRVPDQSLIADAPTLVPDHLQATRGGDRSYAFIYTPISQAFSVDLSKLSGTTINAWWYNPRDGTSQSIGDFAKSDGVETFQPPYGLDWVLVLDDISRGYTAPGQVATTTDVGGAIAGRVTDANGTIPYRLFRPSGVMAGQKLPLVLFLHGMGERGTDNQLQLTWIGGLVNATRSGPYAAYVLAPQIDTSMWFQSFNSNPTVGMELTLKALHQVINTENVDTSRIYVTGLSMGGMGTWDALRREPNTFAAAVPMSGGGDVNTASLIKDIPVWAFHGSADPIVPVSATRDMIQALRDAGGSPKYTEVAGGGHVIWDPIYYDQSHTLYPWLFAQRRSDVAAPAAPLAASQKTSVSQPPAPAVPVFSIKPVKVEKPKKPATRKADAVFNTVTSKPPTKATTGRRGR